MSINKKITIPLTILTLLIVVGGWLYKSGRLQKLAGWHKGDGSARQQTDAKVQYTCPMHPFIVTDKPGSCPICGMTLVKKVQAAQASTKEMQGIQQVSLSPTQMVMANVATQKADRTVLVKVIDAVGIVQYDQARQAKVTSWVAGRIDRLYVDKVGDYVSAKRPVAELYSPDLVATEQEYLLALKSRDQLKDSPIASISADGEGLVASARQRLRLWGVKDSQIAALEKSGRPDIRIPIYTPLSGIVIDKLVLAGQYVKEGDPLFSIADLSRIWTELEVYENDFPNVKVGQKVEITSQSYPGKTFTGRVSYIYPFLDPKTRTVKVRVELPNPGMRLKPDMFVNASIRIPLAPALVVPASAVMDTGQRKVVWLEAKPGVFEPRDVTVGERDGDQIQILSGLFRGDRVAVSGGYLIDSESQLQSGGEGDHGAMPGMKMESQPASLKPASPAKKGGGLDMGDMKM